MNFFDPAVIADPFAFYREAHASSPVLKVSDAMTVVFGYDLCVEATGRPDVFSNDFQALLSGAARDPEIETELAKGWPQVDTLLTADPPRHTRFRKLVNLAFSARRVAAIEDEIRAQATALIATMAARGAGDFVQDFAIPLPVAMIASQIGFEADEHARVKRWTDAFVDRLGQMSDKAREFECAREVVDFQHAVKTKIDARRSAPAPDLLSDLVHASLDDETPLDDAEILSIVQQMMVAGNETTTSALAGGMLQLVSNPTQLQAAVAAADARDERAILNLVEEVLRTESPTSGMWRVVVADAELGGVAIAKGSMLHLRYAAANRDPARYPDPDRFDIARSNARSHLAFGKGIHMCVGNMLSRKELAIAFAELLRRLEGFALADGHRPHWPPNMLLRGLTTLPLSYRPRA